MNTTSIPVEWCKVWSSNNGIKVDFLAHKVLRQTFAVEPPCNLQEQMLQAVEQQQWGRQVLEFTLVKFIGTSWFCRCTA